MQRREQDRIWKEPINPFQIPKTKGTPVATKMDEYLKFIEEANIIRAKRNRIRNILAALDNLLIQMQPLDHDSITHEDIYNGQIEEIKRYYQNEYDHF